MPGDADHQQGLARRPGHSAVVIAGLVSRVVEEVGHRATSPSAHGAPARTPRRAGSRPRRPGVSGGGHQHPRSDRRWCRRAARRCPRPPASRRRSAATGGGRARAPAVRRGRVEHLDGRAGRGSHRRGGRQAEQQLSLSRLPKVPTTSTRAPDSTTRPVLEQRHRVADALDHVHLVGDHQHGQAEPGLEGGDQVEDLAGGGRVERAGGLVAQQHVRIGGQCAGDADALPLPAGQLRAGRRSPASAEADQPEQLAAPWRRARRGRPRPVRAGRRRWRRPCGSRTGWRAGTPARAGAGRGAARSERTAVRSTPLISTVPDVGRSSIARQRTRVDLPAPDWPITPCTEFVRHASG